MTMTDKSSFETGDANEQGYKTFTIGGFTFSRDEFFAHIAWPTGRHVLSVDTFLRALQRDVAWDFFYGTVNFDTVIGTVNHYGNVDMFAGRYNDAYRKAELDHVENFDTPMLRDAFKAMLDDWTNSELRPVRQPRRDRQAVRREGRLQHRGGDPSSHRRGTHGRRAGRRADPLRRERASRSTGCSPTSPRRSRSSRPSPGFESEVAAFNLFAYLSRSQVTWNPSVVSVCKDSLYCPTTEEYILPVIHGNDRVEWFVQLSDEIIWDVQDRDTGAPCARRSSCERATSRRCPPTSVTRATPRSARCCSCGRTTRRAARADRHRSRSAVPVDF